MVGLVTMLQRRTHRDLELIARAHNLPFTRREPKAQGLARLQRTLAGSAFEQAYRGLTSTHIDALQALVTAGGALPLRQFKRHFGKIRFYRPWRFDDGPRHPWRRPLSPAERLYHLGYILLREDGHVEIVDEVQALLPVLARPASVPTGIDAPAGRSALLGDLAVLLGTLLRLDSVPNHGRWLSLAALREVNAALAVPDDLQHVRSELQTRRLRWLHYLAVVANLVSVQAGYWKPTVTAWDWLAAPAQHQWDVLMQAVDHDLEARVRQWDRFRLPEVSPQGWRVMRRLIADLTVGDSYRVRDVLPALKPYLLPDSAAQIGTLIRDGLVPCGLVSLARGRVTVLGRDVHPAVTAAEWSLLPEGLRLRWAGVAHPSWVKLLGMAPVHDGYVTLDDAAIRHALRQGLEAGDLHHLLGTLLGAPPPDAVRQQIRRVMQGAVQLTLKPAAVLQAADPAVLQQIATDWRLKGHFVERLSPRHLAVALDDADLVRGKLERRGHTVTSWPAPASASAGNSDGINGETATYLLLAVRAYQKLSAHLDASIHIPKALTHWLAERVRDPAGVEFHADRMLEVLQKQVPAASPAPSVRDSESIRRWITEAHRRGQAIKIDYRSPYADGKTTTRTVTISALYESDDVTYFEAYCDLAGKVLTFRLDRVLAVYEIQPTAVAV